MAKTNGKQKPEPAASRLYEVLKGIDFERRELVGKRGGAGLFDLVREPGGAYRCYACTLCERTCPVDCIDIGYCPEHEVLPWDVAAEKAAAATAQPEIDMKPFDIVIARLREGNGLIEALHTTQETYGWLPRRALEGIAEELHMPFSRVFGVASFYSQFRLKPMGKNIIKMCDGTACHVNASTGIMRALENELQIGHDETTEDGFFSLQKVACLGCCSLSPVIMVNDETYGRLTPKKVQQLLKEYREKSKE